MAKAANGPTSDAKGRAAVIKLVYCFKRKPGLPEDQFREHWHTVHAPIGARIPGLRGLVQSAALRDPRDIRPPDFDGMAELWFDDVEALFRARESSVWVENREDQERFIDLSNTVYLLTEEKRIV